MWHYSFFNLIFQKKCVGNSNINMILNICGYYLLNKIEQIEKIIVSFCYKVNMDNRPSKVLFFLFGAELFLCLGRHSY